MSRSEPISIESLLQKQRDEKIAASKVNNKSITPINTHLYLPQPKFLSKEDRAKLAIEKRAQEIKEQREREEAVRRDRDTLEKEAQDLRRDPRDNWSNGGQGRYGHRSQFFNTFHFLSLNSRYRRRQI
jgi:ATP-dependent RNA helicase DDX23/PRP28